MIDFEISVQNTPHIETSHGGLRNFSLQVCIPVGCVQPACCPYLRECTARGVSAPSGGVYSRGMSALGWGRGLNPSKH